MTCGLVPLRSRDTHSPTLESASLLSAVSCNWSAALDQWKLLLQNLCPKIIGIYYSQLHLFKIILRMTYNLQAVISFEA